MATYSPVQKKLIELAMEDILSSPGFINSSQLSSFLSFIITKTLDDEERDIKGYTIGVDALGRSEDFDPQIDPSVRVMAGRLRQALDNYNRDTGGFTKDGETVQIELIKGSYVPKIKIEETSPQNSKTYKDKLSALETTDIDIGLDKVIVKTKPTYKKYKLRSLILASFATVALFSIALTGYHYYSQHHRIEPTILPQKQTLALEDATLPSLTLFINVDTNNIPDWTTTEELESASVVAFSRFNEFRIFNYAGKSDLVFLDQVTSDYYLSIYYSKATENDNLEAYISLTKPPESEVVWSDKVILRRHVGEQVGLNMKKISAITSDIMSPYGIIHGDITSNKNPPPRLDCIRAIYSYFAKEDLQAYANGLDCARRATSRENASSSMFAMLAFMYVEAYRKQIIEVSDRPLKDARMYAQKAITLDPRNARAFQALFAIEKTQGHKQEAMTAASKALNLNPYDRDIIGDYAAYLVSINEQISAKPVLDQAIELTPVLPAWLAFYTYLNADVTGNFETADKLADKFDAEDSPLLAIAIILSSERQNDEARALAAINTLNIIEPGFAKNPRAALLRRGFESSFANELAIRLENAGLNNQLTLNNN